MRRTVSTRERIRASCALVNAIEERRRSRGLTLDDVCVDVDRSTYIRWRRGDHEPKVGQLSQVLKPLGGRLVIVWD